MEIDKSNSRVSSKASSRSSKKKSIVQQNNESDDISMSQLELLANKKKLNKKSEEISIDLEKEVSSKKSEKVKSESVQRKSSKSISSSSSSSSSESSVDYKKDKRRVQKENKNEVIRKEKSDILFKLYSVIEKSGGRWSSKMSMDNSLEEIKTEFTRIKATLDNESMVKFCKHGLVMGIKGVEMLNNAYDPLGVDLDGWGEAMSFNMATTEYDEVLSELCDKYKSSGSMSPEVKLLVMIVMSGAMFSFSKKAAKDPSTLTNLMSSFMGKSKQSQPPQPQQAPQQPQQQQYQQQQYQQPQYQQPQSQQHYTQPMPANNNIADFNIEQLRRHQQQHQQQMYQQQMYEQQQNDVESDDSDNIPSKLRGPVFDTPDSINIENIIKTMKDKKKEKEMVNKKAEIDIDKILNGTDSDEEPSLVKDIPAPKRGKGRQPKKQRQWLKMLKFFYYYYYRLIVRILYYNYL